MILFGSKYLAKHIIARNQTENLTKLLYDNLIQFLSERKIIPASEIFNLSIIPILRIANICL